MSSPKLKEALHHTREAEKALKTSWLKWTADYDTAASEYTKAATCYKLAGSNEQAMLSFINASQMQEKLGALFHGAKLLTQAAQIANDIRQSEQAVELMNKASFMYREHGSNDTAALTLAKAGKMCESGLPSKAVELFKEAAKMCETDEKNRDACDHLNHAIRVIVKTKADLWYSEAVALMRKRMELLKAMNSVDMAFSIVLTIVIVYLSERDLVAAQDTFQDGFNLPGFGDSTEATHTESFLNAFKDGDEELLVATKRQPLVKHLDVEICRLAMSLRLINESEESEEGLLC